MKLSVICYRIIIDKILNTWYKGGIEKEVKYLNNINKKLAWKTLLQRKITSLDLCDIIIRASDEKDKLKAWDQLRKREIGKSTLRVLIEKASGDCKAKASAKLLGQKPANEDLCWIIKYGPKEWKDRAWNVLLGRKTINEDLCKILNSKIFMLGSEEYKRKASEILLQKNSTNAQLCQIIAYGPGNCKSMAWKMILKRGPDKDSLMFLITDKHVPEMYKTKASREFLEKKPDIGQLHWLITKAADKIKDEAWEKLLKQDLTKCTKVFREIIAYGPDKFRDKAWEQLLKQGAHNYDLQWLIAHAPDNHKSRAKNILEEREIEKKQLALLERKSTNELIDIITKPS